MRRAFGTTEGRQDFRQAFPIDSGVIPVDLLAQSHDMLKALDVSAARIRRMDLDMCNFLREVAARPALHSFTHEGLESLFYAILVARGILYGQTDAWRTAKRRFLAEEGFTEDSEGFVKGSGFLHRDYADKTPVEFCDILMRWAEAFESVIHDSNFGDKG